jgi:hypothetical protein
MLDTAKTTGYEISVYECEQGLLACAVAVHADRDMVAVTASVARVSREALIDVVVPELQATALAIELHTRERSNSRPSWTSGKWSTSSRIRGTRPSARAPERPSARSPVRGWALKQRRAGRPTSSGLRR